MKLIHVVHRPSSVRKLLAAAAAVMILGLAGCGDGSSDQTMMAEGAMPAAEMPMADAKSPVIDQQIIRTAYVTVRVADVIDGVTEVRAAVAADGGTISTEDLTNYDGAQNATLTVRVPAKDLDSFLAGLADLGTIEQTSISAADVTTQVIDLDARITSLKGSIARLTELQSQAANVADLVAVETELANRQAELESLQSQRDYLGDQVAMSTVTITLVSEVNAVSTTPDFLRGLETGWNALLSAAGALVTAAGFIIPFAIVIGIIVLVVRWIIRRRKKSGGGAA
ncbi:MAG: DUF4349 domain-containing protein [Actinobacteria bacterium]|nr:DUF4349 domain-containing protein [Actinomycetota bacterium]